ncbi:hypothetical protein [Fibrella aestuarina]|uniref:hypothetical protein n=1 Tax=Fibrella aestuarina TaxID=651143 RepID=UPI00059C5F06|nr:hypothetical protein [Fibrella aestuarina]
MKCFFSFKASADKSHNYDQLLKVAVYSALKNTTLQLYCIFDGLPNELTKWLESKNVTVIFRRSYLYNKLAYITCEKLNNPSLLNIGGGAFLRVEIPAIMQEFGYNDRFVLYTDCDVMFQKDVAEGLSRYEPKFFAVAPENNINSYRLMNSGVMLMNMPNLQKRDKDFRNYVEKNLESYIPGIGKPVRPNLLVYALSGRVNYYPAWDQSAYQHYYTQNWLSIPGWDKLPPSFNWKPYWGDSSQADIVHFHGPKPNQAQLFSSKQVPVHLEPLIDLATPSYFESSRQWNALLKEEIKG